MTRRKNKGLFFEALLFLWRRKVWWLTPILLVLLLMAFLIFLTQGSAVSPFIYPLI